MILNNLFLLLFIAICTITFGQKDNFEPNNLLKTIDVNDISQWDEHWVHYNFDISKEIDNNLVIKYANKNICHLVNIYNNKHLKTVYTFFQSGLLERIQEFDSTGGVTGKYCEYYDNGKLRIVGDYKDGLRIGERLYYYKTGSLLQKLNYKNGLKDGEYKIFYENGQLQEIGSFKEGLSDGYIIGYYENGIIDFIYYFLNNKACGTWYEYYENGKIKQTIEWNINYKITTNFDSSGKVIDIKKEPSSF